METFDDTEMETKLRMYSHAQICVKQLDSLSLSCDQTVGATLS